MLFDFLLFWLTCLLTFCFSVWLVCWLLTFCFVGLLTFCFSVWLACWLFAFRFGWFADFLLFCLVGLLMFYFLYGWFADFFIFVWLVCLHLPLLLPFQSWLVFKGLLVSSSPILLPSAAKSLCPEVLLHKMGMREEIKRIFRIHITLKSPEWPHKKESRKGGKKGNFVRPAHIIL